MTAMFGKTATLDLTEENEGAFLADLKARAEQQRKDHKPDKGET